MREIKANKIRDVVKELCIDACINLPDDVLKALEKGLKEEKSSAGKEVFSQLIKNTELAKKEKMPICQDTGVAVIFLEIGQEVIVVGGSLYDAINEGVKLGYTEGYLRKSIVRHPLDRVNTKDNAPAVIHAEIVEGDKIKISIAPKGGGSENMSRLAMLSPAQGIEGVKKFVLQTVSEAGANPCPPIIVGIGLGGTFEKAALLSKKALLRDIGEHSKNPIDATLEKDLLEETNKLGFGPQGLGGKITALWVSVESYPCHITAIPVAVNINCHAARHKSIVI